MTGLVLVGGGRFALEIATYVLDLAPATGLRIIGIIDDSRPDLADFPDAPALLGGIADWQPGDQLHLLAIGEPVVRWKIAKALEARGARFATLIHPTAYVAKSATISSGAVVAPLSFVGPKAVVGAHAALNVQCALGHDAVLGRASVLSPGAKVNGGARIGEATLLGAQAAIAPGVSLGSFAKLSAGSVLTGDLPDGSLAVGNPARGRVMFRRP